MLKKTSRRSYRKKPANKRKYGKSFKKATPTISVRRISIGTPWALGNAATSDFWRYIAPTAGNFYNFSEFANVFDQYKFSAIKVTFRPRFSEVAAPVTGATPLTVRIPYACIVRDPQSTVIPTGTYGASTLQTLLENGGKIIKANRTFSVYLRPKVQCSTTVGSGTYYKSFPYIDTGSTAVTARGFHIMLFQENFGTSFTDCEWDIYYTFYAKFKNVK